MKYILRVIVLPFYLGFCFVGLFYHLIKRCILFIKYGGELITYHEGDKKTIEKLYLKLKENEEI